MIGHLAHAAEAVLFGAGTFAVIASCASHRLRVEKSRHSRAASDADDDGDLGNSRPLTISTTDAD